MSASKLDLDNESAVVGKQRQQTQQESENKGDCAIAADSASCCETNADSWIAVKPILVNTNVKQEIVNIVSLSVEFDKVHITILN
jgi:hypothetical protein